MFEILTDGQIRATAQECVSASFSAANALIAVAKKRSLDTLAGMKYMSALTDYIIQNPLSTKEEMEVKADQLWVGR